MQGNQVASLNIQPLTLKVVVRLVHGHVWHSPWTLNQSQHGYLVVVFLDATTILQWLEHGEAISLFYITTDNNRLFAVAIAYINMSANKQTYFCKTRGKLCSLAISSTDMCSKSIHFSALPLKRSQGLTFHGQVQQNNKVTSNVA